MQPQKQDNLNTLEALSDRLNFEDQAIAMILAAGHGKRIKSETPKMIHQIWGVPTVLRVANAARDGLGTKNQIIIVGIKAEEVAQACGRKKNRVFAYQAEQHGTGHAVRIGLEAVKAQNYDGTVYIFPGDVGLLNRKVVGEFRRAFLETPCDMMVLTSIFKGKPEENYYGRIIRVPAKDVEGLPSGEDEGKVIEIIEHKDILSKNENEPYVAKYNDRRYAFSRQELLETCEFNTGLFAFRSKPLVEHIYNLREDNVQGELYVTDLISIFNQNGLSVRAFATTDENAVLGFNVKSVLKQMEDIARNDAYEKLKDTITIVDKEDFFIADEVIEQILRKDAELGPLDIVVGKGAHIGPQVQLNRGVNIGSRAYLSGNVVLGENVKIQQDVHLSSYAHQTLKIGANTEIYYGNIVKGNLSIGENSRIESGVNMTGSDDNPTRIGNDVLIKGTSYVFGCVIEDEVWIERSVLKNQYIAKIIRKDGSVQPIRWIMPPQEGREAIRPIEQMDYDVRRLSRH
jgi:bifunctional UDP-N-acetylglucosamine pyrophosphorylase/glucosamine-1-phosphate N-acetyltransferase